MNGSNLRKRITEYLITGVLAILIAGMAAELSYADLCTNDNFGKYTYDKQTAAELQDKYQASEINFSKSHKALKPLATIKKPRYRYSSKSGIYTSSSVKKDGVATIMLTGDIMCQTYQQKRVKSRYGKYNFNDEFYYVKNTLSKADLVVGNLETTLCESASYMSEESNVEGHPNCNAPSTFLGALRYAGYDVLMCSNNHCCDCGVKGIYQSVEHMNQYGLIHTGLFTDEYEPRYVIVKVDGIKVGFVSYSTLFNSRNKYLTSEGQDILLNRFSQGAVEKDVEAAKEAGAEYIIGYIHWGKEYTTEITDSQKQNAKYMADAGVDMIIGSHPHVIQKFDHVYSESGKKVPVMYSMGNFVSQMESHDASKDAIIIRVKLKKNSDGKAYVAAKSYIPCRCITKYSKRSYTVVPLTKKRCATSGCKKSMNTSYKRIKKSVGTKLVMLGSYKH